MKSRAWAFAGRVPGGRRFGGRGRRRERGESCGDTDAGGRSRSRRGELRGEHRVHRVVLERRKLDFHALFPTFTVAAPVILSTGEKASFVKASCGVGERCGRADVRVRAAPGRLDRQLTVVVDVPPGDSKPGCKGCLAASSTWLINENKATNSNETFTNPQRRRDRRERDGAGEQSPPRRRLRNRGLWDGQLEPEHQPSALPEQPCRDVFLPARVRDHRERSRARDDDHRDRGERAHVGGVRGGARSELPGAALARTSVPPAQSSSSRSASRRTHCRTTTRSRRSSTTGAK